MESENQQTTMLHAVKGVRLGVAKAGIKAPNRSDLCVIACDKNTKAAAVFTQNAFCAAPVIIAKRHLKQNVPQYCLINTGYANAGLGEQGIKTCLQTCQHLAEAVNAEVNQVLPFSTGVIGEPLPLEPMIKGISQAVADLHEMHWTKAAEAIMTTDTKPKIVSTQIKIFDQSITITGMAKGSGMIHPNMATMLAFIATDASISQSLLAELFTEAVDESFNLITVDGDTSTNDAAILFATGQSNIPELSMRASEETEIFLDALKSVCQSLAKHIVQDGEGATKCVLINVQGGESTARCKQVAYSIARSPLVKTALFASDPNWGRILAAVGNAGLPNLDIALVSLAINDFLVFIDGGLAPTYREEELAQIMQNNELVITIQLNRGQASAQIWTTDLSYDYVKINAEYRS